MRGATRPGTLDMEAGAMTPVCNRSVRLIAHMTAMRYTGVVDDIQRGGVDAATEVRALGRVVDAVDGLDASAIQRVLEWAWKRFVGAALPEPGASRAAAPQGAWGPVRGPHVQSSEPTDLADLYVAARPATDADKVLVVAYWHQVSTGKENLDAQTIHRDLKNLGHGVGNVTRACSALIREKPQLMIQVKKAGSTRQARKQYRLTAAGLQRVRDRLVSAN
jgi:hypothetical protein